jgi:membrane-associated protease RseP (regulator of RpoE activity)
VRLPRIDDLDLNTFEFDRDLTFMVFFLDSKFRVYARYGGRDGNDADNRQSLEGLRATMQSVLDMHAKAEKDRQFAPRPQEPATFISDITFRGRRGRCLHCHQVKEIIHDSLQRGGKWDRSLVWRFPLPENVGFTLDVDRSFVVKKVADGSAAAKAGLKPGDVVRKLHDVPIHSFGDATYALDRSPTTGSIAVKWERAGKAMEAKIALSEGWRRTDLTWRPSVRPFTTSLRLSGKDLTAAERKKLGLTPKQVAFRQLSPASAQAERAGIKGGDIILGIEGKPMDCTCEQLQDHVRSYYLAGEKLPIVVLRDGKKQTIQMTLRR